MDKISPSHTHTVFENLLRIVCLEENFTPLGLRSSWIGIWKFPQQQQKNATLPLMNSTTKCSGYDSGVTPLAANVALNWTWWGGGDEEWATEVWLPHLSLTPHTRRFLSVFWSLSFQTELTPTLWLCREGNWSLCCSFWSHKRPLCNFSLTRSRSHMHCPLRNGCTRKKKVTPLASQRTANYRINSSEKVSPTWLPTNPLRSRSVTKKILLRAAHMNEYRWNRLTE